MSEQFTVSTAAEYSNLSTSIIRRYCQNGRLAAEKVGAVWIIKKSHLDEFLSQERPSPGRPKSPKEDD